MRAIAWYRTNCCIGKPERVEIRLFILAANNHHWPFMMAKDEVDHQSSYATVPIFKRMDTDITIME